jgi:hypothetical protein
MIAMIRMANLPWLFAFGANPSATDGEKSSVPSAPGRFPVLTSSQGPKKL